VCEIGVENDLITVVGSLPYIGEGEQVTIKGKWVFHQQYGKQLSALSFQKILPADETGILRYLSSGIIKGIDFKFPGFKISGNGCAANFLVYCDAQINKHPKLSRVC
jgi:ATP-dependent exoDNAse (exonuclease V) alpha subunit